MSWPPATGRVLPRAQEAHGIQRGLRAYALNPRHQLGSRKARAFRSVLGITIEDSNYLAGRLLEGVLTALVTRVRDNSPYGSICEVLIVVAGLNDRAGNAALTTTVWECRSPSTPPRLLSAYIET